MEHSPDNPNYYFFWVKYDDPDPQIAGDRCRQPSKVLYRQENLIISPFEVKTNNFMQCHTGFQSSKFISVPVLQILYGCEPG